MHIPVLQKEVIEYLDPKPNENFIDCTIGEGGHTLAILEKTSPDGKVMGIDQDQEQIENCKSKKIISSSPSLLQAEARKLKIENFKNRLVLACDNFANLEEIAKSQNFKQVSGILFDLGMSSWHLEESGRGFSFLRNEPLDMRYNLENPLTAEKIVNYWSKPEIEKILREYGEERFAKKIAERIVESRAKPIETTFQLIEIIKSVIPRKYQAGRLHPATRTFQALRIVVNDELNNLEKTLPQAINVLNRGGRLVVISFHSLEDRIVKNFYRGQTSKDLKILTKKPIRPSREEIIKNHRSRSAKLRACQKF